MNARSSAPGGRTLSRRLGLGLLVLAFALAPLVAGNFTVSLMNDIGIGA